MAARSGMPALACETDSPTAQGGGGLETRIKVALSY
jgi:hypothetical protein